MLAIGFMLAPSALCWSQCNHQKYIDSIAECAHRLGTSQDMHGNTIVAGAPGFGGFPNNTGAAFVLDRVDGSWQEAALLLALDGQHADRFGEAVGISGDTIIVGAHQSYPNGIQAAGSAYVFERRNGIWQETQKLVASDASHNARFGRAVAIDGDTIVIGAPQASAVASFSGATYVYERQGGFWVETAKLVADDGSSSDKVGWTVAVSGGRLATGSIAVNTTVIDGGAVYIFEKSAGSWIQTAKVFPQDAFTGHAFSADLALGESRLFVGAWLDNDAGEKAGAVYAYDLIGFSWQLRQKIYPMSPETLSRFGEAVDVWGSTLVVGERTADGLITNPGAFTVYRDTPGGWEAVLRFSDPEGEANAQLGTSVAVWEEHVAAGAPQAHNGHPNSSCAIGNVWLLDVPLHARSFCFGVGCPCGNDDPAAGCAGSSGKGARLAGCGSGSVAADDATFRADALPPGNVALLFRGLDAINGGAGAPFGDGLRCAGTQVLRLGLGFADPAGSTSWGPGLAAAHGAWQAGDTMRVQAWYRDPTGSPCGPGFNTTNAVEAHFAP